MTADANQPQEVESTGAEKSNDSRRGFLRIQLSSDVKLPRNYVPKFPNKCLVCHEVPVSTMKVAHNSQNPFLVFLIPLLWMFGWSRVEIPICGKCKSRYRLQRWGRATACFGLIIIACWFILPHLKALSPTLKKFVGAALVLLAISPFVLLEVLWPPYFDTTAKSDTVDYEFSDAEYADEFRELNQEKVLYSD